jgi:tetratricopeptide (TPR) repeat protein
MALCVYGWTGDQYAVAEATKPDADDKNVSPTEMVAYARSLSDPIAMDAVMGYATGIDVLKRLLSARYPVIVETWFIPEPGDEMGHYRLLTGYDDVRQAFMTQDSYQGANLWVPYAELKALWKVFNRVYVVVCPQESAQSLRSLLSAERALPGNETDGQIMYRAALAVALAEIEADPEDRYAWLNAGTNHLGLGQVKQAAQAYDRARALYLPWRVLWYQFAPFEAYLRAGRPQDVIVLADANLRTTPNLEESLYYRALARRALGDEAGAREDLHLALRYNPLFVQAAEALEN